MSKVKLTKEESLAYHEKPIPGKTEVVSTKPCATQRELSMAYTPGVAEPCREIEKHPEDVYRYTNKGNLVAVISDGTAVLGLGNIGPAAGKPVMEGKGVLFKRFAGIDVFDIELDVHDPEKIIEVCAAIAPTFGGINLEDIKAPECFAVEPGLQKRVDIPVFHDDQHGTAIISGAALANGLEIVGKKLKDVRVAMSGSGAAAVGCAWHYMAMGLPAENLIMCDSKGVVSTDRTDLNSSKREFARKTKAKTLADVMKGADVFIGLSVAGTVTPEMVRSMAKQPLVFAMANPDPEIGYEEAKAARADVIMATGRSDFPNQINNVLGFPFIFRGALDVRASAVNRAMCVAATEALAKLTREKVPEQVSRAYDGAKFEFGPDYLIPKPFDRRLVPWVAGAVAEAATKSGLARKPLTDLAAYRAELARKFPV
ncbi:MAG TPA: malic enzyme-like NAD(P)-binding protein [Planctomycetota bacterium]|nr:malic enzyme-like NAD(P)-binding protein [Planctomycetota bacterium]